MNPDQLNKKIRLSIIMLFTLFATGGVLSVVNVYAEGNGEKEQYSASENIAAHQSDVKKWGLAAAAIAFGLGALGAGIAISNVGAAAMGAVAEKPEIAGQALIFVALAEGLVVFGFITALMILGKI